MIDCYGDYSEEIMKLPVEQRAMIWAAFGERGISSRTIFSVMTRVVAYKDLFPYDWRWFDIPHDPADFRRCYLLLKLIPEWHERLEEMAQAFDKWRPFVDRWDEMTALWEQERENKDRMAPRLYELMQKCEGRK